MGVDKSDILKKMREAEAIYVLMSDCTRMPFVVCDPETYDDQVILTAKECGYYPIQWDVDSLDWKNFSAEKIASRVIGKTRSGSIILCHNNGLHTAESLPLIFSALKEKGFEFVPVGELIYRENYEIRRDGTQIKSGE